jgi:hypothetical protein
VDITHILGGLTRGGGAAALLGHLGLELTFRLPKWARVMPALRDYA